MRVFLLCVLILAGCSAVSDVPLPSAWAPMATNISRTLEPVVTRTLYTTSRANARACASTSCQIVAGVQAGEPFAVIGESTGDNVSGSTLWYAIDYNGQQAYIHSSLMSETAPRPASSSGSSTSGSSTQPQPPAPPAPAGYTCNCSKTCGEMSSCEEAYFQLNTCGCRRLDRDSDGVPCESICPGG